MSLLYQTLLPIVALILGGALWYFFYGQIWKKKNTELQYKLDKAEETASWIIKKAEERYRKAETLSKDMIDKAHLESERRMQKVDQLESRLTQKEERIDQKLETLEQQKESLQKKDVELNSIIEEQKTKLSQVAWLSQDQARETLFSRIETEEQADLAIFHQKFTTIKQEEADKEAAEILAKVLPRISMNSVSEFTVSLVELPSEDMKWKLIGREWRNVAYFEKITGVELLIDDTPLIVKLSSYDNEKRFVAVEMLKRLLKDWRINPVYIEKTYHDVAQQLDTLLMDKGKEALAMLNIPMLKPDIVRMIGQFHFRYSYGQNLWIHSIEVAKIAEAVAAEIGLDTMMAKKAWLLHDIGKIATENGQSHTKVWADILRKYGFDEVIINTAESHHYDVPITSSIWWVVTAADAISAWRPGARFNSKEVFVERMSELEKLIGGVDGVDKVHIMQAGREIMIFVNPHKIDDLWVAVLLKAIAVKVEDQLDYPWIIRVVWIRETKVVDYLR
jgi:ribonucrease Y